MEIEGRIRRHAKGGPPDWIVSVPLLDVQTQGYSRQEALKMLKGAIKDYLDYFFGKKRVTISIIDDGRSKIGVTCSDQPLLMSLILIKQREKAGISVRAVVRRMGKTSPNAYKQYEYGSKRMSIDKFGELVYAVNPRIRLVVGMV
ncbi:MAG: hypothetical protein K1000chlam4_01043 [Chlamydiae bacterium]|nr:hypothetical protein [Chlamydiota bacterium]